MAVNPNWPLVVTQFSTTDPFDPAATPVWVDLSGRPVREFSAAVGRQYELDVVQAGEARLVVADKDEAFNPTNTASPYYPNVKVYRALIDQAMWPPAPIGAAVNLLPRQITPVVDPSFESYTNGAALPWVLTIGSGVTPTVTTTNPQQGTQCLTYAATSGTGTNGVGVTVTCIPGQQYAGSLYVRQTAANTNLIFVNGGASGTSTTTTGAYVRLTVTFTATQPTHQLWVASFTTGSSGTVWVDAIQLEPGAAASTFSNAAGPIIYGNFAGHVERWPSKWNHQGMYGYAEITCVDGFAILAGQALGTEVHNALFAKAPDYYWSLGEPQGAETFAETSGNAGPALVRMDGKFGPGPTFAAGTQIAVAGDPGGTGLACNTAAVLANIPASVVQTGATAAAPPISLGGSAPMGWSAAAWIAHSPPVLSGGYAENMLTIGRITGFPLLQMWSQDSPNQILLNNDGPGPSGVNITVTDSWTDNKPHLYVVTGTISVTTIAVQLYVDGVLVGSNSSATVTGFTSPYIATMVQLGGYIVPKNGIPGSACGGGVYAHLALWNRVLSAGEIADMANAGRGYTGENSGARISRYLGYGWTGPTAIDTGTSTMGVSNLADNTSVLDAVLSVTSSENGVSFVAPNSVGTITFQSRTRRYLATTATWSFGEAESPYEADIAYDYDPTLVVNDPQVTRAGGVTATGGVPAARQASWKRYGKRSDAITINIASDLETQDRADWIFAGHSDPVQRISVLTLKPSANPALWPVCLGLRIGDRATVKRRTAAGYTMTGDYFVERIEQNRSPEEWAFSLQLSPASAALQPWILGDAVYGQLGITTTLGY